MVELEVWDVVGDDDGGEELEEDPVYSFNTLLNGVDIGVLDGDEEDGVGDVVELFCELGCELADEDGVELLDVDDGEEGVVDVEVELDGVDVEELVEEEVELCELALWLLGVDVEELVDDEDVGVELLGVDVGEDGVEDEGAELCELVDVDEGVELLLCELALSMVFIASLRNCV